MMLPFNWLTTKQITHNEYFLSKMTAFCLLIAPEWSMIFCNTFLIQNKICIFQPLGSKVKDRGLFPAGLQKVELILHSFEPICRFVALLNQMEGQGHSI